MYIESVLNGYRLLPVPPNPERRSELGKMGMADLISLLESITDLHNTTDLTHKKRLIRAIEIAEHNKNNDNHIDPFPKLKPIVFGVKYDRDTRRNRITQRLKDRLESGMIDGALVVRMKENEPLEPEVFIAKSKQDILSAAQSKYCPVPMNVGLREVLQTPVSPHGE